MKYVVSKNAEIIANGQRILLEVNDIIDIIDIDDMIKEEIIKKNWTSNKIFFLASKFTPPRWSFDHVGFISHSGEFVQMSGHKQEAGVFALTKRELLSEFGTDKYYIYLIPRKITITKDTLNSQNCGEFVHNVLIKNNINNISLDKLYAIFKHGIKET